ncbi:MAG: PSD1 and planctomycete cytochrome C domain-containing protein [Isosphaerales bacterium]
MQGTLNVGGGRDAAHHRVYRPDSPARVAMRFFLQTFFAAICAMVATSAWAGTDEATAFFESRIRPVLVEHCYKCHSGRTRAPKGGLRLDSGEALLRGGGNGPAIVPGKPDDSLLIKALSHEGDVPEMPPDEKLPDRVLADFRRWIASGAHDPRKTSPAVTRQAGGDVASARDAWAFRPPRNPGVPSVRDTSWARDELDRFILARLEAKGLRPAPDADRYTWLRRVALDLVGLPPSPEQIVAFINDPSPRANELVVDRLLASPAFGERWARHWLDLTGYADQIGTANDIFAEHAWRYRDYVIAAFNADRPFDRFIHEQLAGDLLPYGTALERARNLIATGFLVLGDLTVVEADKAKLRVDVIDQQVDKVGKAFLGMTLGCARCHDHKFDPIPIRDYYALAGIFSSTESVRKAEWGVWSWPTLAELPETRAEQAERKARFEQHRKAVGALTAERERVLHRIGSIGAILQGEGKGRGSNGIDTAARKALETERREMEARVRKLATDIEHAEFFTPAVPVAFAVHDSARPGGMRITIRGNAHALGDLVPRGFVRVVSHRPALIPSDESGRRQLAGWIASSDNPLTARVAVNRIWQKLFGEGIVRSVDYFGSRGETPTHPELLDALALRFVADGWFQKRLIRSLVLSRAYAMSSAHDSRSDAVDPDNRLLWRMNRRRLDAESLRDVMLSVAGTLTACGGGPGLPLEYPENTGGLKKGDVNPPSFRLARFRPEQEFVRTVYLPIIRSGPQAGPAEVLNVFDFTQPGEFAGQRSVTTVPTQALFLMNAKFLKRRALELARRTTAVSGDRARLDGLWLRVLNRPINAAERADSAAFLAEVRDLDPGVASASRELRAWAELCHALLASNEFLVRL